MKKFILLLLTVLSITTTIGQCDSIAFNAKKVDYNANLLNSKQLLDSGLCVTLESKTQGRLTMQFQAQSDKQLLNFMINHSCTWGYFNNFSLLNEHCDTIPYTVPFTNTFGQLSNKPNLYYENLVVGQYYTWSFDYLLKGGACEGLEQICTWFYTRGNVNLGLKQIDKPKPLILEYYNVVGQLCIPKPGQIVFARRSDQTVIKMVYKQY